MKKIIFLAIVICFAATIDSDAQYSINKKKYDYRSYTKEAGDPYNPTAAGIVSFQLPGLGHIIYNEVNRGFGFLAGYAGSWLIIGIGFVTFNIYDNSSDFSIGLGDPGVGLMLVGLSSMILVQIWSITDAIRMTKVNNLAWRDKNPGSSSFMIAPAIEFTPENKAVPAILATIRF